MSKPTRVTVDITQRGWTTTVYADTSIVASRSHEMKGPGHATGTVFGDFLDDLGDEYKELAEALADLEEFGVASELLELDQ